MVTNTRAYPFIPASVQTYGYLCKPLAFNIKTISDVTAGGGPAVMTGSFLASTHRELSVALVRCQGAMYRGCADLLARAAGREVFMGAEMPCEE